MHVSVLTPVFLLLVAEFTTSYYELVEELGCHNSDFRLSCEPLDGQIIILEAVFSDDDSYLTPFQTSCGLPGRPSNRTHSDVRLSFRHSVNKRCSGKNICSFTLLEDHAEARSWGPGSVYLRYACLDGTHILKSCSSAIVVEGEGFVETPGYPRYYVGGRTCLWTLRAPPHKQVQLNFLDIALRGIGPQENNCRDWLLVTEHGLTILATCGDIHNPGVIVSVGQELNITLTTSSANLFPKRGLLFHYKAVGCVIPTTPQDAYLVSRNDSILYFRCNLGYVFPDSLTRDRAINCLEHSSELPDCIYIGVDNATSELPPTFKMNLTEAVKNVKSTDASGPSTDLLAPSLIIGFLFIINAAIIAIVYIYKKRLLSNPDPWVVPCPDETDDTKDAV